WDIQLTLTDRSEMTYLMLLGREAMRGQFIVDPEHDFLLTGKD
ncbi:MAG: RimK/LysX family protein, partial [Pseudomonadota bacterium]|nr:RimK/LysX family protein [Pseudomonadota bacterium]